MKGSTLVSFCGYLLAIGGRDDSNKPTCDIYKYHSHTNSWVLATQMWNKRSSCFAVNLEQRVVVVGGQINNKGASSVTESVEIME